MSVRCATRATLRDLQVEFESGHLQTRLVSSAKGRFRLCAASTRRSAQLPNMELWSFDRFVCLRLGRILAGRRKSSAVSPTTCAFSGN